eukprot:762381_1
MASSHASPSRKRNGQFRKAYPSRTSSTASSNSSTAQRRKKKRKLDLTPTLKHLQLSEKDERRKKKRRLNLTPMKHFQKDKTACELRRSQRIKRQKQLPKSAKRRLVPKQRHKHKANSIKKAKTRRRKQNREKSSLSSISQDNDSSQPNETMPIAPMDMDANDKAIEHDKSSTHNHNEKAHLNNSKVKREFRCVQCNQQFPIHVEKHRCSVDDTLNNEHWICFDEECDFTFDCFDGFREHMNDIHHIYRNLYSCQHCSKRYDRRSALRYHQNRHHLNNARFECCLCKQRHPVLSKLRVHDCEKAKKSEQQHVEDVDHNEPKPLRRPRRNRKRKRSMMENDSASHKGQDEKERDDADTDNRLLCKEKSEEQKEMDIDNRKKSEEQEQEVVDEAVTDNRLLYKEKLELEVYIQTHRQLGNIKCENEAEYRGKLDVLIKKQSELEAMDWKQRELMPIKFQINQRFLDSINTIKSKLNK